MRNVSFPMYDFPEVREELQAFWTAVAETLMTHGVAEVPHTLQHTGDMLHAWSEPDLLLTQCCGYDLVNRFAAKLEPIATPRYSAEGCDGCYYSSAVIVSGSNPANHIEELRGSACVVNGFDSHSGMNALRALVAPYHDAGRFFCEVRVSGSHTASVAEVATGAADVASIDCVTYALLQRYRPAALDGTRVLCFSERAPAIPYVVRSDLEAPLRETLTVALEEVFEQPAVRRLAQAFFIDGVERVPLAEYERIAEFERYAELMGYAELR